MVNKSLNEKSETKDINEIFKDAPSKNRVISAIRAKALHLPVDKQEKESKNRKINASDRIVGF